MAKRESMRGRGADAFFGTEPSQPHNPPVHQQDSKTVQRQASMPVPEPASELVKATFYLTPAQVLKLEHLRLARRTQGQKIDKSALVREAIDALTG